MSCLNPKYWRSTKWYMVVTHYIDKIPQRIYCSVWCQLLDLSPIKKNTVRRLGSSVIDLLEIKNLWGNSKDQCNYFQTYEAGQRLNKGCEYTRAYRSNFLYIANFSQTFISREIKDGTNNLFVKHLYPCNYRD
jgi:hypothetical protein